jgi:hypothetical protein
MARLGAVCIDFPRLESPIEFFIVVVRTGDHTFIGQIASLTGGESGNESPLAVEMLVVLREKRVANTNIASV